MNWISVALVMIALIATIGVTLNRVKTGKGIGERVNQFAIATIAIPIIAVLAIEAVLSLEVTGTLLGAGIGFVANSAANK